MRRRWPLTWAALQLLGLAVGEWSGGLSPAPARPRRPPADAVAQACALAPAALALGGGLVVDAVIWTTTAASACWWGWAEASGRRSRPDVALPDPWRASRRCAWQAALLVRITGWPGQQGERWTAPAVIVARGARIAGDRALVPRRGDAVLLHGKGAMPAFGALVAGVVEAGPAAASAWPGAFDMARFLAGRGVLWEGRLTTAAPLAVARGGVDPDSGIAAAAARPWLGLVDGALSPLRQGLLDGLAQGLPPREASLLGGVLLGERDAASRANQEPFARVGLAHLFAVSGLNVGIVVGIIFFLTRPLSPGPGLRWVLAVAALPAYVVLTGMTGSIVRAAALAALVLAGPLIGRRSDSLHALGVLFWISAQAQPWILLDSGCRLSYLAAAGLVVAARTSKPVQRACPSRWRWLPLGVAATLGSTWFTLPDTAASFGWLNLLAPLANLVAVPLFTAIVWMGTLALAAQRLYSWLGESLYGVTWMLARSLEAGAGACDRVRAALLGIPALGPGRVCGMLAISVVIGVSLRRLGADGDARPLRRRLLPLALLTAALTLLLPLGRVCPRGRMTAVQFAVGQGDCAVLVFPDGAAVLIDTGPAVGPSCAFTRTVAPWLVRERIRRLAGVVLTHAHDDHTAGAAEVARRLAVGRWWVGGGADRYVPALTPAPRIERPRTGEALHAAGRWSLVCASGNDADTTGVRENDRSLAVALCRDGVPLGLWDGDLERGGEARLLERGLVTGERPLQLWKAGHHGSRTSGGAELLERARPALVVVCCGVNNRHRHPSHGPFVAAGDTLPLLRTDRDGSLRLAWDGDGVLAWRSARGSGGRLPLPAGSGRAAPSP